MMPCKSVAVPWGTLALSLETEDISIHLTSLEKQ